MGFYCSLFAEATVRASVPGCRQGVGISKLVALRP